jgi:hypothetical protein
MKKILLIGFVVAAITTSAQSPRHVVIEHFTNTRCSICASRNPGFYSVLGNYPQVIHIAYHPSAPYSNCYFSQQNASENDGRTNYYNTYGSTPDYFLNGKQLPGANPAINNTTIDTALNQLSPIEVFAYEALVGTDSVDVRIVVRTTGNAPVSTARIFAGVAEEPVNYNAPNGESIHHDVFRKALTAVTGNSFLLPAVNDSLTFSFGYKILNGWIASNLRTITIVQRSDNKVVLNAAKSIRTDFTSSIEENSVQKFSAMPNPFNSKVLVSGLENLQQKMFRVIDLSGRILFEEKINSNTIEIETSGWNSGIYIINAGGQFNKIIKE